METARLASEPGDDYFGRMPDMDLDPKDYRASPVKGEPVFHPGGANLLLIAVLLIVGAVLLRQVIHPPVSALVGWLMGAD